MTHATPTPRARGDVVLDVSPEDQEDYSRHSYHDYMHVWNDLTRDLTDARRTGDHVAAQRLTNELRHCWPRGRAVARAAWIPDDDRELALPDLNR
jgi:hypothetical protein